MIMIKESSRDVRNNGVKWNVNPPSRDELYPNMCRDNVKWSSTKRTMAENLGEITSVWMCGVKNRAKAFENGVFAIGEIPELLVLLWALTELGVL